MTSTLSDVRLANSAHFLHLFDAGFKVLQPLIFNFSVCLPVKGVSHNERMVESCVLIPSSGLCLLIRELLIFGIIIEIYSLFPIALLILFLFILFMGHWAC